MIKVRIYAYALLNQKIYIIIYRFKHLKVDFLQINIFILKLVNLRIYDTSLSYLIRMRAK